MKMKCTESTIERLASLIEKERAMNHVDAMKEARRLVTHGGKRFSAESIREWLRGK